jgi:phosphohistidine phosphatase
MGTLYLLRHAKSSWDEPALADHERPLAPRGRRDALLVGRHLGRLEAAPELVLCSSAVRTRETLELLGPAVAGIPVQLEDDLYAASSEALLERLRAVPDETGCVLLIGHNPGVQDLALALAPGGRDRERLAAKFPTAGLATLACPAWARLEAGGAELVAFVVPKQLR